MSDAHQDTNTSKHIVFLDQATFPDAVTVRPPAFPHSLETFARTTADQAVERAKDADIIILNKVPMRAETLAQLPKLKMIAVAATAMTGGLIPLTEKRGKITSCAVQLILPSHPQEEDEKLKEVSSNCAC